MSGYATIKWILERQEKRTEGIKVMDKLPMLDLDLNFELDSKQTRK